MAETRETEEASKRMETSSIPRLASKLDLSAATSHFECFVAASTLKSILRSFRALCESLRLQPSGQFDVFYPRLKSHLRSWQAKDFFGKLDKRANMKIYEQTRVKRICSNQRVLVIGAGPCGLRTAIELQLLGAKVVVLEKRDRFSRNNVLHLWPYTIHDLKALGAKKFFGKFCAGSIDHISIRQLQCILIKVCLLLGVQIFENVGFRDLQEPQDDQSGWKALVSPSDHPVTHYEFDVLIGADGRRNTLQGFKRKEFRGKLAIAITANFINRHTEAESRVEEISGVAFIFNQKFFNDLHRVKGIGLENIVYYKDETHYFVMTAKKQSLLDKGVLLKNEVDTSKLLAAENVAQDKLIDYAREAADYATNYQLPRLEFAVNHYGKPDVAMFDFTSMYQADNSCRIIERHGHRLLVCLVGDSLVEPFWPMGTGCARGFFGGFDACWLIRSLCSGKQSLLECLAEREAIYRILAQTTPENTHKNYAAYTIDPRTRYPNIYSKAVLPHQVMHLVDTDNPNMIEEELQMLHHQSSSMNGSRARRRKENAISSDSILEWFKKQLTAYDCIALNDLSFSFQDGLALCALIHRYRPDLVEFAALDPSAREENLKLALDTLENEFGLLPSISNVDFVRNPDELTIMGYLVQVVNCFRKELPAVDKKLHKSYSEEDDFLFKHNHPTKLARRRYHESNKKTIGELVAKDLMVARKLKKRRSKAHDEKRDDEQPGDENRTEDQGTLSLPEDKENIMETAKLNITAHRKRVERLLAQQERASSSSRFRRDGVGRSSIKTQERFQIIEAQFAGHKQRRLSNGGSSSNKKPKDLKRAIGKLDKDDWQIRNIKQKMNSKDDTTAPGGEEVVRGKVPKWSKAAFQDKMNIMKEKLESKRKSDAKTYKASNHARIGTGVEATLSRLQSKLHSKNRKKEEELARSKSERKEEDEAEGLEKPSKSQSLKTGGSECFFCGKRVYLVERMSAEGKFFHRSCFRCDYCNSLLRIGSYVYKRTGPFQGKFFCIPHGTDQALDRHRQYKCKAEEREQVEKQRQELLKRIANSKKRNEASEEHKKLNALPKAQVERLLSKDARETTPERAEFEVSFNGGDDDSSIMDEDEWTTRNFGQNESTHTSDQAKNERKDGASAVRRNGEGNTDDDSVSNLDSDSESDDNQIFHDSLEPLVFESEDGNNNGSGGKLTAEQTRLLQAEWMRRLETSYQEFKNNDQDMESDSSDVFVSDEDEEYYSSSSMYSLDDSSSDDSDSSADESEADDQPDRQAQTVLSPNRNCRRTKLKHKSQQKGKQSSGGSTSALSALSQSSLSSQFASDTATECQFTDSEGKPNPFNNTDSSRPSSPLEDRKGEKRLELVSIADRYQYKTPNISERMRKEQQPSRINDFSTKRALNLKKNWVSHQQSQPSLPSLTSSTLVSNLSRSTVSTTTSAAPTTSTVTTTTASTTTTTKSLDSRKMDERLKSLMDRLSSQQKLLKPAEKPSSEMQHFLTNTSSQASALSPRDKTLTTSALTSPPILATTNVFKFLPSPPKAYQSTNNDPSNEVVSPDNEETKQTSDEVLENKSDDKGSKEEGEVLDSNKTTEDKESEVEKDDINKASKEGIAPSEPEVADESTINVTTSDMTQEVEDTSKAIMLDTNELLSINESDESKTDEEPKIEHKVEKEQDRVDHDETMISPIVTRGEICIKDEENNNKTSEDIVNKTLVEPLFTSSPMAIDFIDGDEEECVVNEEKVVENDQTRAQPSLPEDAFTELYRKKDEKERLERSRELQQQQGNLVADLILARRAKSPNRANKRVMRPDVITISWGQEKSSKTPEESENRWNDKEKKKESEKKEADKALNKREEGRGEKESISTASVPTTTSTNPYSSPSTPATTSTTATSQTTATTATTATSTTATTSPIPATTYPSSAPSSTAVPESTAMAESSSHTSRKVGFMRTLSGMLSRSSSSLTALTMRPRTATTTVDTHEDRKQRFKYTFPRSHSAHRVLNNEKLQASEDLILLDEQQKEENSLLSPIKLSNPSIELKGADAVHKLAPRSSERSESRNEDEKTDDNSYKTEDDTDDQDDPNLSKLSTRLRDKKSLPVDSLRRMRGSGSARQFRAAHQRRCRRAQTLQRKFEELQNNQISLNLRGDSQKFAKMSQDYLEYLREQNKLIFRERELRIQATLLDLEEQSSCLESELREFLLLDTRNAENARREEEIERLLVNFATQRDQFRALMERDREKLDMAQSDIDKRLDCIKNEQEKEV